MCGIAGVIDWPGDDVDGVLTAMASRLEHRGPDAGRTWRAGPAGLAFRRLAIIDLDERSMQPVRLGPLHLVFNGEIYNYLELRDELRARGHEFTTEGDAEVLLHAWAAWGEAALPRLDGMFSLAVWDESTRTLTCAADPFGEKPLYWARQGETLVFASEPAAVLTALPSSARPDESACLAFLCLGLMPPIERTFFAPVSRLPGGHVLRHVAGATTVERYWSPRRVDVAATEAERIEQLRHHLRRSVAVRLRADVPVGTSLSGGIDSSLVAMLVAALAPGSERHAFTATFPGYARDEWALAAEVASAAEVTVHHPVVPTASGLIDDLDRLVAAQQEPFGSTSAYAQFCIMRAAREAGITVLLDGQGADETFGGYPGTEAWAIRAAGLSATATGLASTRTRRSLARALTAERAPRALVEAVRRRTASPYATREARSAFARAGRDEASLSIADGSPLRRELLRQSLHTSLPSLLRYADRNSMAHSREVRLPFLNVPLAELALSLPPSDIAAGGVTKRLLRAAARGLVPDSVLDKREKIGFETPQGTWLSEQAWRSLIAERLLDPSARTRAIVDGPLIERRIRSGPLEDVDGLWRALCLEVWLGWAAGFTR